MSYLQTTSKVVKMFNPDLFDVMMIFTLVIYNVLNLHKLYSLVPFKWIFIKFRQFLRLLIHVQEQVQEGGDVNHAQVHELDEL